MSTGTEIVKDALKRIGAYSVASPANSEAIEAGRKQLNSMMEMWLSYNVKIGFTPLDVVGDDLNEPADTRNGIVDNLAVKLLPDFPGLTAPANLHTEARMGKADIFRHYQRHDIPKRGVSSTLPRGAGNQRRWNRGNDQAYFNENEKIDG